MNKTDEELNLAEAMAKRHGVRMCDENGDTHGEELYCVGIDDIADIIREALVEQVKQEPVAWDLAEKVRRDLDRQSCPDAYMRTAIESIVKHFPAPPPVQEITEDVDAAMVEMKNIYPPLRRSECERLIRAAKYAAPVDAKSIRAEALEEAEEIAKTIGGSFADEFLAATRELK